MTIDYWAKVSGGNSTQRFHAWRHGQTLCASQRRDSRPAPHHRLTRPHRHCQVCLQALDGLTRFTRISTRGFPA